MIRLYIKFCYFIINPNYLNILINILQTTLYSNSSWSVQLFITMILKDDQPVNNQLSQPTLNY